MTGMETNPYQSPPPEPPRAGSLVRVEYPSGIPPRIAYWMAIFASSGTAVGTLGGISMSAERHWDLATTCLTAIFAAASIWSGRLAMRIKREEAARKNNLS
jgi:hypothetical protein